MTITPAPHRTPIPDDATIREGIAEVARAQLAWKGVLTDDTRLIEALRLDSLRLLTLVVAVEDRFRVCLDEHLETRIETVSDLVAAIRSKLEDGPPDAE